MMPRQHTILPRRTTDRVKELAVLLVLVLTFVSAVQGDADAVKKLLGVAISILGVVL